MVLIAEETISLLERGARWTEAHYDTTHLVRRGTQGPSTSQDHPLRGRSSVEMTELGRWHGCHRCLMLFSLAVEQLFHLVHYAIHLAHGKFQRFVGGHVDAGILQQVDGIFRLAGGNER